MKTTCTARMLILCAIVAVMAPAVAGAAPAAAEPVAIGADIGTTSAGIFVGAAAARFSLDLPFERAWSLDFEPSAYYASGTGSSVLQVNMEGLARFYLMSLFEKDSGKQAQWGPFAAAGAVAAWQMTQGGSNVLSIGPAVEVGYRLVFGDRGIFVEPSLGWMAFLGGKFDASGINSTMNSGMTFALILGYRL